MAKGFPGETDNEIPKRISETLKYQPINHIVPKSGLSNLLSSSITEDISISCNSAFGSPPSEHWLYPHPIDFDPFNEGDRDPILFRRPNNITLRDESQETAPDLKLLKNLPQLGIRCLTVTSLVDSASIVANVAGNQNTATKKRRLEAGEDKVLLNELDSKRIQICVQSNPMNDLEVGKLCLDHLSKLLDSVGLNSEGSVNENAKFWKPLGDVYVATSEAIDAISLTINKVLGFPMVFEYIDVQSLKKILGLCTRNIKRILAYQSDNESESLDLNNLTFGCAFLILEVMMIDLKSANLQLEEYYNAVFSALDNALEKLHVSDNSRGINADIGNIFLFINLLEKFVASQSYLDEMFLIKSVCICCDMLLHRCYQHLNTNVLLSQAERIKDLSLGILISLFSEYPSQRLFITEELLSHVHDIVVSKSTKKLKLVDEFENGYASYFTVALVAMFQSINALPDAELLSDFTSELLENVLSENNAASLELKGLIDNVTTTLFEGLITNPFKFKSIVEIYIQDLLTMIGNPKWAYSHHLLEAFLPKLFQIFSPTYQGTGNFEVLAIQLVGQITATLTDVKLRAASEQSRDVKRIFNLQNEYKECFDWLGSQTKTYFSDRALWNESLFYISEMLDQKEIDKTDAQVMNFVIRIIAKEIRETEISEKEISEKEINNGIDGNERVRSLYMKIVSLSPLFNFYEPALRLILSLLDQQKVKLKSGAVKCLTLLVSKDPQMLDTPFVQETIKNRLYDSSASVRDAILDLLEQATTYIQFYREINCNFDDDSIAVRKHVMRMNEKILDTSSDLKIKTFVLEKVLRRIEDEEDVIVENARKLLLHRLILRHSASDLSVKLHRFDLSETLELLSTLIGYGGKTEELLEFFFHFFVLNPSIHKNEDTKSIFDALRNLVNVLIEEITENAASADELSESNARNRYDLLYFFANCPINFISKPHLYSLFPYLSSNFNGKCYLLLLKVFRSCIKKHSNIKLKFLHDLETTLLAKLSKLNTREIEEALAICWETSTKTRKEDKLLKVCASCIEQLRPYVTQAVTAPSSLKLDGKVQRLIYLCTGFARMCHFKENEKRLEFLRGDEHLYQYVTKCLLTFTNKKLATPLRKIAIKNLVKLASSFPKLFNSPPVLKVLDHEFEAGVLDTKLTIIDCLQVFFSSEEKKVLMKIGANGTISSSSEMRRLISTQNTTESVNDGVCSALVTRYLDSIMDLCLLSDIKDAIVAIKFLQLTLNFHYTNPSHAVPTLIALSCSDANSVKTVSTRLLSTIFEQYESMVFNGLAAGFKKCCVVFKSLLPSELERKDHCMKRLQCILSNNKKNGKKYVSVVKNLTISECYKTHSVSNTELLFLLHNMSQIDYGDSYELYEFLSTMSLVIDEIDETIQDILSIQEDDEKNSKAFSLIKRRKIMSNFKTHMISIHNLSSEKLSFIGTPEEATLKGRSISTISDSPLAIESIVFENLTNEEIDQQCLEYQKEYDAIY